MSAVNLNYDEILDLFKKFKTWTQATEEGFFDKVTVAYDAIGFGDQQREFDSAAIEHIKKAKAPLFEKTNTIMANILKICEEAGVINATEFTKDLNEALASNKVNEVAEVDL